MNNPDNQSILNGNNCVTLAVYIGVGLIQDVALIGESQPTERIWLVFVRSHRGRTAHFWNENAFELVFYFHF